MTKTAVAIRHVHFEDLGTFGPELEAAGFDIHYVDVGRDDLAALDPLAADLLVVLGGPIGVYETEAYPFLVGEIDLIRRRLAAERPTLGICLGAQLIATALGARVDCDRMLLGRKAQQPLAVAMQDRIGDDHLRIQQRPPRQPAVENPAETVGQSIIGAMASGWR